MQLNSPETVMQDPHLAATAYFQRVEHPSEGAHWQMRPAARSSEPGRAQMLHAPRKGQHTREVLAQAGYSAQEIETLLASGAVQSE
jgi:formyl-CoA transferase